MRYFTLVIILISASVLIADYPGMAKQACSMPATQPWNDTKIVIKTVPALTATSIGDFIPSNCLKQVMGTPAMKMEKEQIINIKQHEIYTKKTISILNTVILKTAVTYTRQYNWACNPFVYHKGEKESIVEFSQLVQINNHLWVVFLAAGKVPNEVLPKITTEMQIEVQPVKVDDVFATVATTGMSGSYGVKEGDVVLLVQADVIKIQPLNQIQAIDESLPPNAKIVLPEWKSKYVDTAATVAAALKAKVVDANYLLLTEKWHVPNDRNMGNAYGKVNSDYAVYTVEYRDGPIPNKFCGRGNFIHELGSGVAFDTQWVNVGVKDSFTHTILIDRTVPPKWPTINKNNGIFLITPQSNIKVRGNGADIKGEIVSISGN